MKKSVEFLCSWVPLALFLLIGTNSAQYLFSTTANGQGAYLASRIEDHSFVVNPAFLGRSADRKNYVLRFEAGSKTPYVDLFGNNFPDFELWIPLSSKISLAVRKQFSIPAPWMTYFRSPHESQTDSEPIPSHNQDYVFFRYRQAWSYGVGYRYSPSLSLGTSIRHANYYGVGIDDEYLTLELGVLYERWKGLDIGLVLRDLLPWRIKMSQRLYEEFVYPPNRPPTPQSYRWDLSQWPEVDFKPHPYAEVGISYMFFDTIEALIDISSRQEYGWGFRIRFGSGFSLFGGHSNRYDHLFSKDPFRTATAGFQVRYRFIRLAASYIWQQESYYMGYLENRYGRWSVSQANNDGPLFSLSFRF